MEEHYREVGQGPGDIHVFVAEQPSLDGQRLPIYRFRLRKFALGGEHEAQQIERSGDPWVLVAVQLSLHGQRIALHRFRLD